MESLHQALSGGLVEDDRIVDAAQGSHYLRTLVLRDYRATWPFVAANRGIRVDAHDQYITQSAGGFEIADVADVEQVEGAIGEDESETLSAPGVAESQKLV
jgi:hypothetical protein